MIGRRGARVGRDLRVRLAAALRATAGEGSSWVRELLDRERSVPLPPSDDGLARDLVALRFAAIEGDRLVPRARVDLAGDLVVASDLRRHRNARDFVVGPGPASFTLAGHVRPHRRGRLLDLGAGSGIQGLLLGGPRTEVTAIDINPRALAFTACNAGLNGRPRVRPVLGDFLAPEPDRAHDGRFETVVANPPFVLAPAHDVLYRDRSLPGDEVGARTVDRVARALAPGGSGYVLCNWIDRGSGWSDAARAWIAATRRDGRATRIASLEAGAYAASWTRDLGPEDRAAARADWTAALAAEGVERVHIGVIELSRSGRTSPAAPRFEAVDQSGA